VKNTLAAVGLCVLWMLAGCSSFKVRYAYHGGTDFARMKTYAWMPEAAPPAGETDEAAANRCARDEHIRAAVDEGLARKGLRRVSADPDVLVTFHVTVEERIDVDDWGYTYAARKRYRNPKGFGMVEVAQYEKGTLILDLVDPGTRELVWRGEAQGGLNPERTQKQGAKLCDEAVKKVLKKFPPPDAS